MKTREAYPIVHAALAWGWGLLWPPLSVALLSAVALAPRGLDDPTPVSALLPLLALHWWAATARPASIALLAVAAGLAMDGLSHGPLGYWAIIDLAAVALADLSRAQLARGPLEHGAVSVLHLGALAVLQWGLMVACTLSLPGFAALAGQALGAVLVYPVLILGLSLTSARPVHYGRGLA